MYFGESVEYIREQQEILQEETERMREFLKSNYLNNIDVKDFKENDAKRIIGKLKQEQDQKKQAYMIKSCIGFILESLGAYIGFLIATVNPIGFSIGFISAIIMLVDAIIQIIESRHFAKTDFGDIANRIDSKIDKLEKRGGDKKLIAELKKLYNSISDLDTEEQIHKPSVKVNSYYY